MGRGKSANLKGITFTLHKGGNQQVECQFKEANWEGRNQFFLSFYLFKKIYIQLFLKLQVKDK